MENTVTNQEAEIQMVHANQAALKVHAIQTKKILANQAALMEVAIQNQNQDSKNVKQAKASIHANLIHLDKIAILEKQEINVRVEIRTQEKNAIIPKRHNTHAKAILQIMTETLNAAQEKIELIVTHKNLSNIAKEEPAIHLRAITLANHNLLITTANQEKIKIAARAENQERILEIVTLVALSTVANLTVLTKIDQLKILTENANLEKTKTIANLTSNATPIRASIHANQIAVEEMVQMALRDLVNLVINLEDNANLEKPEENANLAKKPMYHANLAKTKHSVNLAKKLQDHLANLAKTEQLADLAKKQVELAYLAKPEELAILAKKLENLTDKSHNTAASQILQTMIDILNAEVERINNTARVTKNARLERVSIHANQTVLEEKAQLIIADQTNHNIAANQTLQIRIDLQSAEVEKKRKIVNLTKIARQEKASIHANPIQVERIRKTRTANLINLNTRAYLNLLTRIEILNTSNQHKLNAEVEKIKLTAKLKRSITKLARVEKIKILVAQEKDAEF